MLADRYVYTAFARDAIRGVSRPWLRRLYSFAVKPTLAFYFDVPLEEAMRRILEGRPALKFYEAGLDLGLSHDHYESFRLFQGLIHDEYDKLVDEFRMVRMDATERLVVQQQLMRQTVMPHLSGLMRSPGRDVQDALRQSGLRGRYLAEASRTSEVQA